MCFSTILENLKHYKKIKISVTGNSHFSEIFQNSHFVLEIPIIWFLEIKPGNFPKPVHNKKIIISVAGNTVFFFKAQN